MSPRRRTMIERVEELSAPSSSPRAKTKVEPVHEAQQRDVPPAPPPFTLRDEPGASPDTDTAERSMAQGPIYRQLPEADCAIYRPPGRPPTGLLVVLDDGSRHNGEVIRLRADKIVLGRDKGDVVVPHDTAMSATHAELVREAVRSRYRWVLRDLGSRNGTFIRFAKSVLKHDQEFSIGTRRYRFQEPNLAASNPQAQGEETPNVTMGWQAVTPEMMSSMEPSFTEQLPNGTTAATFSLTSGEMKLGTDEALCEHVIEGDPFVSKVHAVFLKGNKERWLVKDAGSTNGIWLRVSSVPLDTVCEFQLGGQRFLFAPTCG